MSCFHGLIALISKKSNEIYLDFLLFQPSYITPLKTKKFKQYKKLHLLHGKCLKIVKEFAVEKIVFIGGPYREQSGLHQRHHE